jgi:hypothetical protein
MAPSLLAWNVTSLDGALTAGMDCLLHVRPAVYRSSVTRSAVVAATTSSPSWSVGCLDGALAASPDHRLPRWSMVPSLPAWTALCTSPSLPAWTIAFLYGTRQPHRVPVLCHPLHRPLSSLPQHRCHPVRNRGHLTILPVYNQSFIK